MALAALCLSSWLPTCVLWFLIVPYMYAHTYIGLYGWQRPCIGPFWQSCWPPLTASFRWWSHAQEARRTWHMGMYSRFACFHPISPRPISSVFIPSLACGPQQDEQCDGAQRTLRTTPIQCIRSTAFVLPVLVACGRIVLFPPRPKVPASTPVRARSYSRQSTTVLSPWHTRGPPKVSASPRANSCIGSGKKVPCYLHGLFLLSPSRGVHPDDKGDRGVVNSTMDHSRQVDIEAKRERVQRQGKQRTAPLALGTCGLVEHLV